MAIASGDEKAPMAMFGEEDVPIPKPVQRSLSVCAQPSLGPAGAAAAGGWPAGDSRFPPVLVMSHPSTRKMATRLVQATTARITKLKMQPNASTNYRQVELWDHVQWKKFKDGWPNIFIDRVQELAGRDVILLASFHKPCVIFEQLSLIYSLPRYLIRSFRLILPFFPTGTMERIDTEGQIVTAKSMAFMLSGIPLAARGPTQIFIFDIHALQERFYFTDLVIPRLLSAIPLLIRELRCLPDVDDLSIAFPDEGAWKRFHSDFPDRWPTITCIKTRSKDKRNVLIREGDPKGRHVVIVDDLVQTGGTLIQCFKALKEAGAAEISMYVTHAVFPQESWKNFTKSPSTDTMSTSTDDQINVKNFWITDSIPHSLEICESPPFKLIPLCDVIADSLLGYDLLSYNQ